MMKMFTLKKMQECKKELENKGWTEVLTSMSDCQDGKYGILYKKDGEEFWLNVITYHNLPEE
jgi:hypothetical protein